MTKPGAGTSRRSCPHRRARRIVSGHLAAAACVIGLFFATPAAVDAQRTLNPWISTQWVIVCTPESAMFAGPHVCLGVSSPPEAPPPGGLRWQLENASVWLESFGFHTPTTGSSYDLIRDHSPPTRNLLGASDPRCRVYNCIAMAVDTTYLRTGVRPNNTLGAYYPGTRRLHLYDVERNLGSTPTHELFHAVQQTYYDWNREYRAGDQDLPGMGWVDEGAPSYVQLQWERHVGLSFPFDRFARYYDQSLHIPPTSDRDDSSWDEWAYGSYEFWHFLGERLPEEDGMRIVERYYIRFENAALAFNGLDALDQALREMGTDGIHDIYPEFVRRRLTQPCAFRPFGEAEKLTPRLRDCHSPLRPAEYTIDLTPGDSIGRHDHRVLPVATNAYLVHVDIPPGEVGKLSIRVPAGEDDPDLHLIVDDQRFDVADPYTLRYPHARRNEFQTILPAGSDSFFVRLAHAPRTPRPANAVEFFPAPIEFVLKRVEAVMTVTGAINDQLDGESYLDYHSTGIDPYEVARTAAPGLVEANTAHLPDTEEGRLARAQIMEAIQGVLGTPGPPPAAAERRETPVCYALIPFFDDEKRSLVRLGWMGQGPFFGRTHSEVRMGLMYNVEDWIYGPLKSSTHAQRIAEDPLARNSFIGWMEGASPIAFHEAMLRAAADGTTDANTARNLREMAREALSIVNPLAQAPPARAIAVDGVGLDGGHFAGEGTLQVDLRGGVVSGELRFTAPPVSGNSDPVEVEGFFHTPVGALVDAILEHGCEPIPDPPDDDYDDYDDDDDSEDHDDYDDDDHDDDEDDDPSRGGNSNRSVTHVIDPDPELVEAILAQLGGGASPATTAGGGTRASLVLSFGAGLAAPPPGASDLEAAPQTVHGVDAELLASVVSDAYGLTVLPRSDRIRSCALPPEALAALSRLSGGASPATGALRLGLGKESSSLDIEFIVPGASGFVFSTGGADGQVTIDESATDETRAVLRGGWMALFLAESGQTHSCHDALDLEMVLQGRGPTAAPGR